MQISLTRCTLALVLASLACAGHCEDKLEHAASQQATAGQVAALDPRKAFMLLFMAPESGFLASGPPAVRQARGAQHGQDASKPIRSRARVGGRKSTVPLMWQRGGGSAGLHVADQAMGCSVRHQLKGRLSAVSMGLAAAAGSAFRPMLATALAVSKRTQVVAGILVAMMLLRHLFGRLNTPSRVYDRDANTVGREYDAWTTEGILEYYWGEHIHLGYYGEKECKGPVYGGKNFIEAKYDFIDKMLAFSKTNAPAKVLDVGCGIGGTSRYIAKKYPTADVTGITISPEQINRSTTLAKEHGISNAQFKLVDALNMTFENNTFDLVWACESGEHMPDKEQYVKEMTRVLKPGGQIVIASKCQRDGGNFTPAEQETLDYLYGEWTHPYFISKEEYGRIMAKTGKLRNLVVDDWAEQTIPAWRHSVWVGVWDPWPVIRRPWLWWKVVRDAWCLEVMHRAFTNGLMEYGMMTATKMTVDQEFAEKREEALRVLKTRRSRTLTDSLAAKATDTMLRVGGKWGEKQRDKMKEEEKRNTYTLFKSDWDMFGISIDDAMTMDRRKLRAYYLKLMRYVHPDAIPDDPEAKRSMQEVASAAQVNQAYETLGKLVTGQLGPNQVND